MSKRSRLLKRMTATTKHIPVTVWLDSGRLELIGNTNTVPLDDTDIGVDHTGLINLQKYQHTENSLASIIRVLLGVHASPNIFLRFTVRTYQLRLYPWETIPNEMLVDSVGVLKVLSGWKSLWTLSFTEKMVYQKYPELVLKKLPPDTIHKDDPGFFMDCEMVSGDAL